MKTSTKQNTFKRSVNIEKIIRVKLIFIFLLIFIASGFASDPANDCMITCPPDMNVSTAEGFCDVIVNYPPLITSGDCMGITYNPANGSSFHVGSTMVTVTTMTGQLCTLNVHVTATPITGGILTGPDNVCRGSSVTYCRAPVQGALNYTWNLPAGVTGSSNTNCITVTIGPNFTNGTIFASSSSGCGSSTVAAHLLDVALAKPAKPADIHPGGPVCAGTTQFFCASFVPGTEHYDFWIDGNGQNAPLTLGQQIGTCINVNIPAGYNNKQTLKVKATNCMGQSAEQKLDIKATAIPNMPGNITGPANVCHSQLGFYSINNVAGATQYNWSISNNVWIAGGQGTTNLALDYNLSTGNSALLSVTAENGCGISAPRTKAIVINTVCKKASETSELSTVESIIDFDATVYPNPTSGRVTLQFTSATDSKYSLNIYDMTGRVVMIQDLSVTEGTNQFEFDLTSLPKQVYLLRLGNESVSRIMRLGVE